MIHLQYDDPCWMPALAGERSIAAMGPRAWEDASKGLPMQSEHPAYARAYQAACLLLAAEAGDLIVAAGEYRREDGQGLAGINGLHGADCASTPAEFIHVAHLRLAVAHGVHLIDPAGQDITPIAFPIQ